jgi:hypothetical protein
MKISSITTLAALLVLGLVVGCSGNPSQDSQPSTNSPGTSTQQAPAPATQPAPATTGQQTPPSSI